MQAGGNFFPSDADCLAGFAFDGNAALEKRGIDRLDDLAERDRTRLAGKQVAACLAAAAVNETGAAQIVEDLHQEIPRNGFPLRQLLEPCKTPAVMDLRELGKRPARVFQFL